MSLILEALKKSEQQRRLGEAPTLGSPMIVMRRRRRVLPALLILASLALGLGWWLLRTPEPSPVPQQASTPVAPPAAAAVTPAPPQPPRPATTPTRPAARAPAGTAAAKPAANPKPSMALPADDRPGSVAKLPPASPLVAGPRNTPAAPAAATPPAAAPAKATAAAPAAKDKAGAAAPAPATPAAANVTRPAATRPVRPAARAPALPSVWELPYSTRKDLPRLSLTMHLYAPVPRERFVVIDGERYVEGDEIADGVTLHEIRAEGMVLDFKGQRFVYPRDGR